MTKTKSTKRALLASGLALLLCVSMLVGSTFAWFTDTVTSSNNKIVAGNLDVVLEYKTRDMADWVVVDENTKVFDDEALYEPGYTEVVFLRISNAGSLALKYRLAANIVSETPAINVDNKEFKLSDHLMIGSYFQSEYYGVDNWGALLPYMFASPEQARSQVAASATKLSEFGGIFTDDQPVLPGDKTAMIGAVVLYMPETVGNEANHKSGTAAPEINLGISLLATQYTDEEDSFNNQYDEEAKYAVANDLYIDEENNTYVATSTNGLSSVATLASKDSTITSVTYVTDAGEVEVPVVREQTALSSAIASNEEVVVAASGDYTMPAPDLRGKELTIVGTEDTVIDASAININNQFVTGTGLVFDGVTLNFDGGNLIYMGFANVESITYKNCHITGMQLLMGGNVSFENCVLDSSANTGEPHSVWTYGAKNVTFTDCEFIYGDRAVNCYKDQDIDGGKQVVDFKNCTFTTTKNDSEGAVEINSSAFSVGIEVNMDGCTAPANGDMVFISKWDGTNGAKTTINVNGVKIDNATVDHD